MKNVFLLFVLLTVSGNASAQQYQNRKMVSWISAIGNVQVHHIATEIEGSKKLETVYSKARGVTILSAINNVNNRALRKLKTEASMLGADAILITNNYQKGVQFLSPVQVSYTAVAYISNPLALDEVKEAIAGKEYVHIQTIRYSRNAFGHKLKIENNFTVPIDSDKLFEENGKIMIHLDRKYQVVDISEDHLVLSYYSVAGKVLKNKILLAVREK